MYLFEGHTGKNKHFFGTRQPDKKKQQAPNII